MPKGWRRILENTPPLHKEKKKKKAGFCFIKERLARIPGQLPNMERGTPQASKVFIFTSTRVEASDPS